MLGGADDQIDGMLSRLLQGQRIGSDKIICESLLEVLPRLLVVDGVRYRVCVSCSALFESDLKRMLLGLLVEENLRVEEEREVLDKVGDCQMLHILLGTDLQIQSVLSRS